MHAPPNPGTNGAEDEEARRWLAVLRSGSPDEKARARRRLAEILEARGNATEAVNLLVTNAREGYRDADLFQALALLYRQLGDEYLAASRRLKRLA
jgi:predicted Zn-dependent protease